jgi:transcriptional antiterminator NusG
MSDDQTKDQNQEPAVAMSDEPTPNEDEARDPQDAAQSDEAEAHTPPEEAASGAAPAAADGSAVGDEEPMITPGMNWFVLRVASNKEDSVRETLLKKVKIEGFTHLVNRILVPTEKQKQIKAGKQKVFEKKLYPGYVFVEMKLEPDGRIPQDIFFLIKETTGVGDFIGTAGRPSAMSIPEIEKMMIASRPPEEEPAVEMKFQPGDSVKIIDGPFMNTDAKVDELMPDRGKVRVSATVFGRSVPIELEYWQIERAEE